MFQAIHKDSQQILAIKQVPVDTDLQEIIKEISIMQQCDSPYVVKYYGSYFKNTDLWVNNLQYTLFKHHLLNTGKFYELCSHKEYILKNEIRLTEVYFRICWKSVGISLGFVAGAFCARMHLFYLGTVDHQRHRHNVA